MRKPQVISGRGVHPLHPPPRSVPALTLKMTTAQIAETSVTVNNNSPIQDYVQPDDQTQPTFEMTPGFKPFARRELETKCVSQLFLKS